MQVSCPHCSRVLDVSGDPPVFCAYCGQPLKSDPRLLATAAFGPGSNPAVDPGIRPSIPQPLLSPSPSGADETAFVPPSGSGSHRSDSEPDPETVAGYAIVRLLGRGGMGSVYEAEDSALGRRVAIKLIGADHVTSEEAVERFRQEGRLASTIAHPRCVFVLGADEHQGRPYIVMELMPGETLQALVERQGPLPVGDAVAKILDVIEGLQEAHLQGVIHRDVKPSNCFLDADGRVKVGDFGLSKSLDGDAGLTRTGSFIGTPLYASPEQIKRDAVDERTDVYSVAATLYFLLTGRPPYEGGDAAAVLARIVSEDPTPMRELRPELPTAIETAILRGMNRDRDHRWADLERFRQALLPFVSSGVSLTDQALRVSAYMADMLLVNIVFGVVFTIFGAFADAPPTGFLPVIMTFKRIGTIFYFGLLEGLWGASLGKRLSGLRISRVGEGGPPGLARSFVRALVFLLLTAVPGDLVFILLLKRLPDQELMAYDVLSWLVGSLGYPLMASSMRSGNGFRGLHEWASGTRVIRLAQLGRRRVPRGRRPAPRHLPENAAPAVVGGVLQAVGPFRVRGAVRWDGDRRVLLGEDPSLGRPVWLVLRPRGATPPSAARRDLGRPGRPRWLNGGEQSEYRWDAYAPQLGCSLADLAGPVGLPWADARPILHDLATELARACADGTLPESLSVDQVWVQPDGTVQLVDPLQARATAPAEPRARALELLLQAAALALEGGRRRLGAHAPVQVIHAAVPEHAGRMLDRLIGRPRRGDAPYSDVSALVADFESDRDKPTEVDTPRRAGALVPSVLLTIPVAVVLFAISRPDQKVLPERALGFTLGIVAAAVVWSAATRGGLMLGLTGLTLIRSDGRPAERWRCGLRALVAWLPVVALLAAAILLHGQTWPRNIPEWLCWCLAIATLCSYIGFALGYPARCLHDLLAGTWLVPR